MIPVSGKNDNLNKQRTSTAKITNINTKNNNDYDYDYSYDYDYDYDYEYESAKETCIITHSAPPDKKRAMFSTPVKNPYWPETLWKDGTLIYSFNRPDHCLGAPTYRNDRTIRFNSRFESGNLMYVYRLSPDVYHCILEYDHSSAAQCQWFYFQMSNIKLVPNSSRKTTFYITGFNKPSGVFSSGSKIFMYSEKLAKEKNIGWFRTGSNYAYGVPTKKSDSKQNTSNISVESGKENNKKRKGKHKQGKLKRSTLQFQVSFPYDEDVVYFCYAQPYTFTDLNNFITQWVKNSPSLISKSILCKTNGEKDCPLLTITSSSTPYSIQKKCIFLTARIHPGESNGSIVLHGLIEYLLSKKPFSQYLLDHFVFKIVPMVNIDGVVEGYYRVGLEGEDLNRVWNKPDPTKHPVVFQTKKLMHEMNRKMGVAAYIDFHGHSREHGTFAYGCPWEESENLPLSMINKEKIFPKILANLCEDFCFEKCVFSIPQKRKDASRCVVRRELGVVNSFTIESSFGGHLGGLWSNTLYNDSTWKEIGEKVGESLYHLLAEPATQVLKSAEKEIAATFPNKPEAPPPPKKKVKIEKIEEKLPDVPMDGIVANSIVAIDTNDGIKVIRSTPKAKAKPTPKPAANTNTKPAPRNNAHKATVSSNTKVPPDNQESPNEAVYTLKMSDLYSSSSSSSVKTNPRITMNKNNYINSIAKQNSNEIIKSSTISSPADNKSLVSAPTDNKSLVSTPTDNKSLISTPTDNRSLMSTPTDSRSSVSTPNNNNNKAPNVIKIIISNPKSKSKSKKISSSRLNSNANRISNSNSNPNVINVVSNPSSNPNVINVISNPSSNANKISSSNSNSNINNASKLVKSPNKAPNTIQGTNVRRISSSSSSSSIRDVSYTSTNVNNTMTTKPTTTNTNNGKVTNTVTTTKITKITNPNTTTNIIKITNSNTTTSITKITSTDATTGQNKIAGSKTDTNIAKITNQNTNANQNKVTNPTTTANTAKTANPNPTTNQNKVANAATTTNINKTANSNPTTNQNKVANPTTTTNQNTATNQNKVANPTTTTNQNTATNQNKVTNANTNQSKVTNPAATTNQNKVTSQNKVTNPATNPNKATNTAATTTSQNKVTNPATNPNQNKAASSTVNTSITKVTNPNTNTNPAPSSNRNTSANTNKASNANANASKITNQNSNTFKVMSPTSKNTTKQAQTAAASRQKASTNPNATKAAAPAAVQKVTPNYNSDSSSFSDFDANAHNGIKPVERNPSPTPFEQQVNYEFKPKQPDPYYYEESSTQSYLSTQTESNSFGFLEEGELNDLNDSDSSLLNYSTATFNSSSAYGKPSKRMTYSKPKIKTPMQKQKNSNNSKSPKIKS